MRLVKQAEIMLLYKRLSIALTTKIIDEGGTEMDVVSILSGGLVGLVIGVGVMIVISKAGLNKDQQKAAQLLDQASIKADATVKQAILDGRTQVH